MWLLWWKVGELIRFTCWNIACEWKFKWKQSHISLPMRVNPLNGQTVWFPIFRIFIFTVDTSTKNTALYTLWGESSDMIRKFVVIGLNGFTIWRFKLRKLIHLVSKTQLLFSTLFLSCVPWRTERSGKHVFQYELAHAYFIFDKISNFT